MTRGTTRTTESLYKTSKDPFYSHLKIMYVIDGFK